MSQNFTFEQIGTVMTNYEDGRVHLVYGRPGENIEEVIEQGEWVRDMIDVIHDRLKDKEMTILADLSRLDRVTLDDRPRAIYKEVIDAPYIHRVALVGDAFSFTKVMSLLMLITTKGKVKFFFNTIGAKDWLGW